MSNQNPETNRRHSINVNEFLEGAFDGELQDITYDLLKVNKYFRIIIINCHYR